MIDETYQGWTNRETWCLHLWLANEPDAYEAARMACNQRDEMIQEAAQSLEDWVTDLWDDKLSGSRPGNGWTKDLINCALARVNWVEVAHAFRE